ncbi:MAG: hypothetical protein JWQ71_3615 [Pedosphaera sp.]|nr:hypothetical protein [Pedosphaera sp.]
MSFHILSSSRKLGRSRQRVVGERNQIVKEQSKVRLSADTFADS